MTNGNRNRRTLAGGQRFGASRWHRALSSPVAIVFLAILLAFTARAAWGIYEKDRASAERLAQAQANVAKLQGQQASLEGRIAYLSTDQGVEAELREKYRAVKDGESVAVVVDPASSSAAAASSTPSAGWLDSFLRLFGF